MLPDQTPNNLKLARPRALRSVAEIFRYSFPLAHNALSEHTRRLGAPPMYSPDRLTAFSMPGWWNRRRRVIIPAVVAILAAGAFLLWGPVGLGNGPVAVRMSGAVGWTGSAGSPVLARLPIYYSGHRAAVIDGVQLVGGTRFPVPPVLTLEVLATSGTCTGLGPARRTSRGFAETGCPGTVQGPLIGRAFGSGHVLSVDVTAAAEMKAPPPGQCWVTTKIVVRYHIGIRHFNASGQFDEAVCNTRDPKFAEIAMDAAAAAS